jgi:hypothetical protein
MRETKQTETQSVYSHGLSVWSYTEKILAKDWEGLRIPTWLSDNSEQILAEIHDKETIREYNVFHDCGKPFCLVEENGKRHFPDHARISKETWISIEGEGDVANLIGWDMVFHTETAEQIINRNFNRKDALTLLITAVAELHSNAEMFGGIESDSFKIKWKKIDKRGRMFFR